MNIKGRRATARGRWLRTGWMVGVWWVVAGDLAGATLAVASKTQLATAASQARPGDEIVWQDGVYTNLSTVTFEAQGAEGAPIVLRPQTPGGVVFRGNTKLALGGRWLVVNGFRFDNRDYTFTGDTTAGSILDFRAHSDLARHAFDCRVTNCTFVNYDNPATADSSKWILLYGARNRFDHNYLTGKTARGAQLVVELNPPPGQVEAAHRIDHNRFANRPSAGGANEYETLRLGTSTYSDQAARVQVDHNHFYRCNGEAEIISGKSGENRYLYNTFVECAGSLTLRHGRASRVEGNLFLGGGAEGTGGIRVTNEDHVIVNNHLQDLTGTGYQAALAIMDGTTPTPTSNPDLSGGYVQVRRALFAHNTLVNVAQAIVYGVGKGSSGRTKPPVDVTFAGNLLLSSHGPLITLLDSPLNPVYAHNLFSGAALGIPLPTGIDAAAPGMVLDPRGLWRPGPASPARGAAATAGYPALDEGFLDWEGDPRPRDGRDIGADQDAADLRPLAPLSAEEVGPLWMRPAGPLEIGFELARAGQIILRLRAPGRSFPGQLLLEEAAGPAGPWSPADAAAYPVEDVDFLAAPPPPGESPRFWRLRPSAVP